MNPVRSIIRRFTRKIGSNKLNILTAPTHERYETGLCKTGHNFYSFNHQHFKKWNNIYGSVPNNYILLDERLGDNQLPLSIDFDLVLSQNKFGQFQVLSRIANILNIPLISLEHTLPVTDWPQQQIEALQGLRGDINVFISEYSKNKWGFDNIENSVVIHHGVDHGLFKPNYNIKRKPQILSVVNDWIGRDFFCGFNLWKRVTNGLPVFPIGDTKGFSSPAKDINELVRFYQESLIFINTSLVSPIPSALLEAMSCGCLVVSTNNCMIPEVIEHGKNGFITNDENEMRKYLELGLSDPEMCKKMGDEARNRIMTKFTPHKFVDKWNDIFYKVLE